MTEQLELFPELPVLLRPPRRLREIGFQLNYLSDNIARLLDCRRRLDRSEADVAEIIAEAKALGRIPRKAYGVVVEMEENRKFVDESLRDAEELHRFLEDQLNWGIDNYLRVRSG